jgi:hypothetical protein
VGDGYLRFNTTSFGHALRVEPISVSLALLSVLEPYIRRNKVLIFFSELAPNYI